ncbi:MAG: hypothetical protein AVDCRST_MAG96-3747, partial [uncultured Segetibacter sp.]
KNNSSGENCTGGITTFLGISCVKSTKVDLYKANIQNTGI